ISSLLSFTTSLFFLSFFFKRSGAHRDLPSFPTRRSSDLGPPTLDFQGGHAIACPPPWRAASPVILHGPRFPPGRWPRVGGALSRSEEHTSELQSLTNLVCRLLLEKKNITAYILLRYYSTS